MPFVHVRPEDTELIAESVRIMNAARAIDDPEDQPEIPEQVSLRLAYGWDLEPGERHLYYPTEGADAVAVMGISWPKRDNFQLVTGGIVVHPDHRRRGHGSALVQEILRKTHELGRSTVWLGTAEDDLGARKFVEGHGFVYGSHDARRKQRLAEVDHEAVNELYAKATAAATDYTVERLTIPTPEDVLAELVEVTAAINDAPMGDLTFEDEKFDLSRLQDFETAATKKGERMYRVFARHKETGQVGGHTVLAVSPFQPTYAGQYDTAVSRDHRGHKLGLLLKIEMMRWMAEAEPQIETIETWNQADNTFMISVNESIGYRLSRIFAEFELKLTD